MSQESLDYLIENKSVIVMISNMNLIFGNQPATGDYDNLPTLLKNQCSNIFDEIEELELALKEKDNIEIVDAIADIITFAMGGSHIIGQRMYEFYPTQTSSKLPLDYTDEENSVHLSTLYAMHSCIMADINALTEYSANFIIPRLLFDLTNLCEYAIKYYIHDSVAINDVMAEVTRSNFSKVCIGEEERDATIKHYEEKGLEVYTKKNLMESVPFDYYVVYSAKEQLDDSGKMYRGHKFLKCVTRFRTPDLASFVTAL